MNASLAAEAVPEIDRKAKVPAPLRSTQLHSRDTGGSNPPRSATQSLSLAIPRPNHRKARHSGVICKCVVAEKTTFLKGMGNSRPKSLLANLARPFGPEAERSCDGRGDAKVSNMRWLVDSDRSFLLAPKQRKF